MYSVTASDWEKTFELWPRKTIYGKYVFGRCYKRVLIGENPLHVVTRYYNCADLEVQYATLDEAAKAALRDDLFIPNDMEMKVWISKYGTSNSNHS